LKGGDFRISSGKTYLKTGVETSVAENRTRALNDGKRVITDAIQNSGAGNSPAAWYWLGRIYLQQADLAGADSAFTKVEQLAPTCKDDTDKYRRRAWAALVNGGIQLQQAENADSALLLYQTASSIYRGQPLAFLNIGLLYTAQKQNDSALVYFEKAANALGSNPKDTSQVRQRNQAGFNHAVLLLNAQHYPEAIKSFERYLTWVPDDPAAEKALASAFRAAGMTDSARALESKLVTSGGTAGAGGEALSPEDMFDLALKQFGDKNYADAAATFAKVLETRPNWRDALFNQANAYLALQDGANLAKTAQRLIDIEPLNEYDYQLQAQGYKFTKNQAELVKTLTAREGLPVSVEITGFKPTADGAKLIGTVTGRESRDAAGKAIKSGPVTITLELLGQDGNVVSSQDITLPQVAVGAKQDLQFEGKGAGITAWRYKKK
jgi:tetratricopeptide (TPR) repeat protein